MSAVFTALFLGIIIALYQIDLVLFPALGG